jgi:transaldolase
VAKEICDLVDGPVSLEVVSTESKDIIEEARRLAKVHENAVVKIPMIEEGLKALKVVSQEGIRVNVTLVFSATQALLAAKNGAIIVSPFVGRLDDISTDGMDLISDILTIYDNYGFETEVLVASIRSPMHVLQSALMGAHIATMPYKTMAQMVKHPLSDIGLKKFLADWEKQKQLVHS